MSVVVPLLFPYNTSHQLGNHESNLECEVHERKFVFRVYKSALDRNNILIRLPPSFGEYGQENIRTYGNQENRVSFVVTRIQVRSFQAKIENFLFAL